MPRKLPPLLLLVTALLLAPGVGLGQGSPLTYGQRVLGEIGASAPVSIYTFSGAQGDLVIARVISADPAMVPTIGLNSPIGQQLAFAAGSDHHAVTEDTRAGARLEADGQYTLQIGALPGGSPGGTFLLFLDGYAQDAFTPLSAQALNITLDANSPAALFSFEGWPDAAQTLTITGRYFTAEVLGPDGQLVAVLNGSPLQTAALTLGPGTGVYSVIVLGGIETDQITLTLSGAAATSAPPPPGPAATEEAQPPSDNVCTVSGSNVNVRSGPNTGFPIIGALNGSAVASARTADGWYRILYGSQDGYVAASVVTVSPACSGIPVIASIQPPTAAATVPGVTATYTATPTFGGPTTTATVSGQTGPTPTSTPTAAAQEAPADSDPHTFAIDRDAGGTFNQVVSGPGGDNRDRISTIVNLLQSPPNSSRTVDLTLACSGTGTEYIRWTRQSPNAQQFTCGQTIRWRYAYPNSAMDFYVFYLDGSPATYVSYTITAVIIGE